MPTDPRWRRRLSLLLLVAVHLALAAVVLGVGSWERRRAQAARTAEVLRSEALAEEVLAHFASRLEGVEPLEESARRDALRRHLNPVHLRVAREHGVPPADDRAALDDLVEAGHLVELEDSRYYTLKDMTHSSPALVGPAVRTLDALGRRFHADLAEQGLPPFRFVVSSATRTRSDQARLRGANLNAATQSAHGYGTTVDILYSDFTAPSPAALAELAQATAAGSAGAGVDQGLLAVRLADGLQALADAEPHRLEGVLGRTLVAMQDGGAVIVVYERRQPVFHTTLAGV